MSDIRVFAGRASESFAALMCERLGVPLSDTRSQRFANDCLEVQLMDNCRERDVYLVQSHRRPGPGAPRGAAADDRRRARGQRLPDRRGDVAFRLCPLR